MLVQRDGRIFAVLGVCSFLAARFCYCYLNFLLWLGKTAADCTAVENHGGECDAMILAAAQATFWPTLVFDVCS